MRDFVENNRRENGQRPYGDLADEVFQRYFAGENFIMNTATIAKRQGGEKDWSDGILEYWSLGRKELGYASIQFSASPCPSPLTRMKLPVHRFESRAIDMRIDLCRRDVGVTQHRLDRSQVGAAFEQVRGEGVA